MSRLLLTLAIASALAGTFPAGAEVATFGYSNGTQGKNNVFSNKSEVSGLALRLNAGKTALLKGRSITGMRVSFGSRNTVDKKAELFLCKELGGDQLRKCTATITSANKWLDFTFDEPYVIGENEGDLYIGYTLQVSNMNYKPLSADFANDLDNVAFIFNGTGWSDMMGSGKGMPNIFAILDQPVDFTDAVMMPFAGSDRYIRRGEGSKVSASIYNLGSTTINSIEGTVVCRGNETPLRLEGLEIAHGSDYSFSLPVGYDTEVGTSDIEIRIDRINGSADADPGDNMTGGIVCIYPSDNERGIMMDFFTGQGCSQCPGGHSTLHNTLAGLTLEDELFYVAHHAGYFPDSMTTNMALEFTSLYGGNTYAPAFSVNRLANDDGNIVNNISSSEINRQIDKALQAEPYVSLDVKTEFNPETRELKLDTDVYCFKEMSDTEQTAFNAFIVQDNIISYQTNGGSDYNHSNVERLPIFESAWGKEIRLSSGETSKISASVVIPEKIRSDYWTDEVIKMNGSACQVFTAEDATYDAPFKDLSVVVYVARHDNNRVNGHAIVNAMRLNLGESRRQKGFPDISGVESVNDAASGCTIAVEGGMIRVSGDHKSLEAFTLSGQAVRTDTPLAPGSYIVRVIDSAGNPIVKKFMIR